MAETAAATPSGDSSSAPSAPKGEYGKEFSKPIGVKDEEIFNKHFGKDAVAKHRTETREKADAKNAAADKPKPKAKDDKAEGKSEPKPKADAKAAEPEKKPKAAAVHDDKADKTKAKPDAKAADKAAPKGKVQDESEPEETAAEEGASGSVSTSKARKLYAEAEAAEDPAEARRLYKSAMREAFGKLPPEFDDRNYGAIRQERRKAKDELAAVAKKNEDRIAEAVRVLEPSSQVMRKLQAGLGEKLTWPIVDRAIDTMKALRDIENGDFTALSEIVSRASGKPHDEAMKLFVRGVKMSPDGRAARQLAETAQRETQEVKQQLQALQRQLAEKAEADKVQQTESQRQAQVTEHREHYLDQIESDLDGHPVLKLPRGKERVLAYLIKTADKTLKAPKYSFEQAADRIVAHEKKRLRELKGALDTDGEDVTEPAALAKTGSRTVPRGERTANGVREESAEARFDRIFEKHNSGGKRR